MGKTKPIQPGDKGYECVMISKHVLPIKPVNLKNKNFNLVFTE